MRCDAVGNARSAEEIKKVTATQCELKTVNKAFMLDEHFRPGSSLSIQGKPLTLRLGEMVEIYDGQRSGI